jgi:hypothetical protein
MRMGTPLRMNCSTRYLEELEAPDYRDNHKFMEVVHLGGPQPFFRRESQVSTFWVDGAYDMVAFRRSPSMDARLEWTSAPLISSAWRRHSAQKDLRSNRPHKSLVPSRVPSKSKDQ